MYKKYINYQYIIGDKMKKFVISFIIVIIIVCLNSDKIVIPKESIRIRVIPNSNTVYDQNVKNEVKKEIEKNLSKIVGNPKSIEEARININNNIDYINDSVSKKISSFDEKIDFDVNYGMNYFPKKIYNGVIYDEGMYESLVITLGSGKGDNWWCVLFPPFCLIEATESEDVVYKFKVKEIIEKYF